VREAPERGRADGKESRDLNKRREDWEGGQEGSQEQDSLEATIRVREILHFFGKILHEALELQALVGWPINRAVLRSASHG
jgi:hypothetical protein